MFVCLLLSFFQFEFLLLPFALRLTISIFCSSPSNFRNFFSLPSYLKIFLFCKFEAYLCNFGSRSSKTTWRWWMGARRIICAWFTRSVCLQKEGPGLYLESQKCSPSKNGPSEVRREVRDGMRGGKINCSECVRRQRTQGSTTMFGGRNRFLHPKWIRVQKHHHYDWMQVSHFSKGMWRHSWVLTAEEQKIICFKFYVNEFNGHH